MILYQYMDLKYLSSCFENGVYASKLEKVNDPYEALGIEYPSQFRYCRFRKEHPFAGMQYIDTQTAMNYNVRQII